MFLIAGLGNPGAEYYNTRHNLGFRVVDELASRLGLSAFKTKHQSFVAETLIGGHKIILAQPQAFMNNSGPVVRGIIGWYKITPPKLILIFDDVDLEVGQLRLREKGNAGGHHGVESVIASLGATEFSRVRIGIGRENLTGDVSNYVLQPVPPAQREAIDTAIIRAADAVEEIVNHGIALAMNKFNA